MKVGLWALVLTLLLHTGALFYWAGGVGATLQAQQETLQELKQLAGDIERRVRALERSR